MADPRFFKNLGPFTLAQLVTKAQAGSATEAAWALARQRHEAGLSSYLVVLQAEVDGAGFLAWDHMIADRMTFLSGSVIRLALGPGADECTP